MVNKHYTIIKILLLFYRYCIMIGSGRYISEKNIDPESGFLGSECLI
jgi:hypothetical protein